MPDAVSPPAPQSRALSFNWLILFRTFSLAISLPMLLCAFVGVLLTPAGWRVGQLLFLGETVEFGPRFQQLVAMNAMWPFNPTYPQTPDIAALPNWLRWAFEVAPGNVGTIYWNYTQPFWQLFHPENDLRQMAYLIFGNLWMILVWALFGGIITRIAVVRLGREEPLRFGSAFRYVVQRLGSYFAAPLAPFIGTIGLFLLILPFGWLMQLDIGALVTGILYIPLLLAAFVMVILLAGLLFGWPLMWGAISSEETGDAFEAFSRSFSYTYQRPLHYLFYAIVALLFSALGWLVVFYFAEAVLWIGNWALSRGAGVGRLTEVHVATDGMLGIGGHMLHAGEAVVRTIIAAFSHSLLWCLAGAVYLLLRYDVDQTELDEVYMEEDTLDYELPELTRDARGVAGAPEERGAGKSDAPSGEGDAPEQGGDSSDPPPDEDRQQT